MEPVKLGLLPGADLPPPNFSVRHIPVHWVSPVNQIIDDLVANGYIEACNYPTIVCASSYFTGKKDERFTVNDRQFLFDEQNPT